MRNMYLLFFGLLNSFLALGDESHNTFINGCQAYVSSYSLETKPIESENQLPIGYCLGLVDGVSKTIFYYNDKTVCFPEPAPSLRELVNSVMSYIHEDPEKVKRLSSTSFYSTSDLVHIALMSKYSCKAGIAGK